MRLKASEIYFGLQLETITVPKIVVIVLSFKLPGTTNSKSRDNQP